MNLRIFGIIVLVLAPFSLEVIGQDVTGLVEGNPTNKPVGEEEDEDRCKREKKGGAREDGARVGSFSYWIDFGGLPFVGELESAGFGVRKLKPTPEIYSPTSLYYDTLMLRKARLSGNSILVYAPDGEQITYQFTAGSTLGSPSSDSVENHSRLEKLDEFKVPTAGTAHYLREYFSDESILLYTSVEDFESGQEVWRPEGYTTASGLEVSFTQTQYRDGDVLKALSVIADIKGASGDVLPGDSQLEVILEGDATLVSGLESIRQVKSAQGLANITRSFGLDQMAGPSAGQSISNPSEHKADITTTGHGLKVHDIIVVSNAPDPAYEGLREVMAVTDANNFTIEINGSGLAPGTCDWYPVEGFRVDIYAYTQIDSRDAVTGMYTLTGDPYLTYHFYNPAPGSGLFDNMRVVKTWDGVQWTSDFTYEDGTDEWTLKEGSGEASYREVKYAFIDEVNNEKIYIRELWDSTNTLVSKLKETKRQFGWGYETVEEVQDPDGGNPRTTTYDYYSNRGQDGYGRLKSVEYPDGSWVKYEYDGEGRITKEIEPWKNSLISENESNHRVAEYSYTPEDANDALTAYDTRARKVTVRVGATVIGKTFYAYYFNGTNGMVEIEKRAIQNDATYTTATNEVTTKTYYGTEATNPIATGRLKSVSFPDGTLNSYEYVLNVSNLNELFSVSKLYTASSFPSGVDGKSTRNEMVYDYRGLETFNKTYALISGTFEEIDRVEQTYTNQNLQLEKRKYLLPASTYRVIESNSWLGGELETRSDDTGISTSYEFDDLGRLLLESKTGVSAYADAATGLTYAAQDDIMTEYERTFGEITCDCDGETITRRYPGLYSNPGNPFYLTSTTTKDAYGRVSRIIDENGYETQYAYDDAARTRTVTQSDGSAMIYAELKDGRLQSLTGTGIVHEYYEYSLNFNGSQTTTTRYRTAVDDNRKISRTVDMLGRATVDTMNTFSGSTASVVRSYGPGGWLTKVTSEQSAPIVYEYDVLGNLERTGIDLNDSGVLEANSKEPINETLTTYAYLGVDGSLAAGIWRVTSNYIYGQDDDPAKVKVSERRVRLTGFTGSQTAQVVTQDVHGNKTVQTHTVDRTNKIARTIIDTSNSSIDAETVFYNGLKVCENAPTVAAKTEYSYDGLGRLTGVHDPRHVVSSVKQFSAISYAAGKNQIATKSDAAGHTATYTYYGNNVAGAGRIKTVTDPLLNVTRFAYDLLGNRIHTWGTATYPVSLGYNNYGQLEQMVTFRDHGPDEAQWNNATWPTYVDGGETVDIDSGYAGASVTKWVYDDFSGLLEEKRYFHGTGTNDFDRTRYDYDAAGRLTGRTWDDNDYAVYAYDQYTGRLTNINYSDNDTADLVRTYTRDGRLKTVTDVTGTRTFVYDASTLQLDYEDVPAYYGGAARVDRHYAGTGVLGRYEGFDVVTDPAGTPVTAYSVAYGYETTGRLRTVTNDTLPGTPKAFTYAYVTNANLIDTVQGPIHTMDNDYEPARDLRTVVTNYLAADGAGSPVSRYTYRYDAGGRRTDVVNTSKAGGAFPAGGELSKWTYDTRSQVDLQQRYAGPDPGNEDVAIPAEDFAYSYDTIGNRITSKAGTASQRDYYASSGTGDPGANRLNQYNNVTNPAVNFTYDGDGNMTENGSWNYEWNGENRLIRAWNYSGTGDPNANGEISIAYAYDYVGRRVERHVREYTGGQLEETKTRYLYDGWNLAMTFEWDSVTDTYSAGESYTWGLDLSNTLQGAGGVGGLLMEGDRYPLYDANGNIGQKLGATGTLDMAAEYGPFGEVVSGSMVGAYGFSTKWQDPVTGMHDYGFRWYSANLGRWLNRDPIGESGGLNLYGFVENDGINWIDYLGLKKCKDCAGIKESCIENSKAKLRTDIALAEDWLRGQENQINNATRMIKDNLLGFSDNFGPYSPVYDHSVDIAVGTVIREGTKTPPHVIYAARVAAAQAADLSRQIRCQAAYLACKTANFFKNCCE